MTDYDYAVAKAGTDPADVAEVAEGFGVFRTLNQAKRAARDVAEALGEPQTVYEYRPPDPGSGGFCPLETYWPEIASDDGEPHGWKEEPSGYHG